MPGQQAYSSTSATERLKHTYDTSNDDSSVNRSESRNNSPLKFKGKTKTPIPKKLNPFLLESVQIPSLLPRSVTVIILSGNVTPVLMSPARRPPRKIHSPGRDSAQRRVRKDILVQGMQQKSAHGYPMGGQCTITNPSLDFLMWRVGLTIGEPELQYQEAPFDSLDNSGANLDVGLGQPLVPLHLDAEQDSDSDSLDEINNTAHPISRLPHGVATSQR